MIQPKPRYWFKARFTVGSALQALTDEKAGKLCKAIWKFAETGEEVADLPSDLQPLWAVFRADLIQDATDRINGAKGGNPALVRDRCRPTYEHGVQGGLNRGFKAESESESESESEKNQRKSRCISSDQSIRETLNREGYTDQEIDDAFTRMQGRNPNNRVGYMRQTIENARKEKLKNGYGSAPNQRDTYPDF